MKLSATVLALSTLCLAVSACGTPKYTAEFIPTPPERLVCELASTRPTIKPTKPIDWARITTVAEAKLAHEDYAHQVLVREGVAAGYILSLEGELFRCYNNMHWRQDFEAGLATKHPPAH